ncbi:unnamed protein product, partial [Brachionus calyciflorus]
MNNMTAIKNNIEILRSDLKIRTANGMVCHISGITKPLEVDLSGHKCFIEFLVFDHEDHDVLLGLDWFKKTGCGIFLSQVDIFKTDVALSSDLFWNTSENTMVPASDLNPSEKIKFNTLSQEGVGLFAKSLKELGKCSVKKHYIRLIDKDVANFYTAPYRISQDERNFLKKEIEIMLEANIIRPSKSPWSSPVVVVGKKDKSRRICIDYRKLNKITQTEKWPITNPRDIDRLRDSEFFEFS